MSDLKELLMIFRDWDRLWKKHNENPNLHFIKPSSQERFLEELNKRYTVIKKEINE
jgi:hypothetical protein